MYTAKLLILQALSVSVMTNTIYDTKKLLTKLFSTDKYDKNIRPIYDQRYALTVYVDFALQSIIDFDEQEESMKTAGHLIVSWFDEYLIWDKSDYNNISYLYIPQDKIWTPDLTLRNNFDTHKELGSDNLKVKVHSDGQVYWSPFQVLQSTCSVDIRYFPFDKQTCDLRFTTWSYVSSDVQLRSGEIYEGEYNPSASWRLLYSNSRTDYNITSSVIFSLTLRRRPTFFLINIIIPMILISVLNTFTFLLPVESGERASFSMTVFLALAVFLTIVSDRLPNNSDTVSLMSVYLTTMTSRSTFIVIACLAQIRLSVRKEEEQPVTGCYAAMVKLANCCCCNKMGKTWLNVVHITDFIFFWLSFIYTVFITSMFAHSAWATSTFNY